MMDKRIAWEIPDGSVRITVPAPDFVKRNAHLSEDELLDMVADICLRKNPDMDSWIRLANHTVAEIPLAAKWGRVWEKGTGGKIVVNVDKCRVLKMQEIRDERDSLLVKADDPTAREMEQNGPNKQQWIDYKQALRDVPVDVDLSTIKTAEELESYQPVWPSEPQ